MQSPPLRRLLRIQAHLIENPRNGGIIRALSADAALQHGLNPSANIIDELHAHRDGALYTGADHGHPGAESSPSRCGSRPPVPAGRSSTTCTRSWTPETGELEDRGTLRIYRDRINGTLIWWYGAPADADTEDPEVWRAANPASWLQDGKELGKEYQRLRAKGALTEWRTYHLDQFVESLEQWMDPGAWAACSGDPVFEARIPTYAAVRIAHAHRSAAVAIAQRQDERVMLRVRSFPESPLPDGAYVEAEAFEAHIVGLHERYRAQVTAEVRYRPMARSIVDPVRGRCSSITRPSSSPPDSGSRSTRW